MEQQISVVVPIYKVERYLDKCINSLLSQTYHNLEIVLVDDGSPDNCPVLCDRYAQQYENVKTYHKPNGGLGTARNYGVEKASGNLIVFVDSDDYVEPTYVEDLWCLFSKYNADIAITRIVREYEGKQRKVSKKYFSDYKASKKDVIFTAYTGGKISWGAYGKLFKKKLLQQYPFPTGLYEDAAIMYKIINECDICAIGDYHHNYHYVTRNGSILIRSLEQKHYHIFDICEEFSLFISQNYPDISIISVLFYRRAVTQLLNLQKMNKAEFKQIFYRYRSLFRLNFLKVLKDRRIPTKTKYYLTCLCTTPWLYKLQYGILGMLK
ncbi:MAG: glycosyltransferase family 2 protein [Salinivirgaceae bacterium]|nr:glycosyltransferase family 2 protein [Salinivirgaceae bacterium]